VLFGAIRRGKRRLGRPAQETSREPSVPTAIERDEVRRLVESGAQLAEVLPRAEYDEEHLPGAIHLPLKSLTGETANRALDRTRPVIVYCWDAL
jgi:rhodanese-related sulfurtransferase